MSEPFVGEIIMFGGNFAIRGWAHCDGQLLAVSQNDALFSLLGTTYGGDGRTTFGLPDLRGRTPLHTGTGPGLSPRSMGAKFGGEHATVSGNEMPPHNHGFQAETLPALSFDPTNSLTATPSNDFLYGTGAPPDTLGNAAIGDAGAGSQHANLMPALCVGFQIALVGIYPSRN